MKKIWISLLVTYCTLLNTASHADECQQELPPFALITVPKAGSHMIIKALHLMTGSIPVWHTRFPSFFHIPAKDGFLYTHFCVSPELEDDYLHLPPFKKIVMIRDLRDVAISIVSQISKSPWPGLCDEQRNYFLSLSFDEQLLFVINYEYDVKEVALYAPNSLQVSLSKIGDQAVHYTHDPNVYTCRYENLVGSSGGGCYYAQINEIKNLAEFLNLPHCQAQLSEIASQLYGNEMNPFGKGGLENFQSTFSKGKIGRWKKLFKEEHKQAFKKKVGHALISLGYEPDNNW